MLRYLFRQPLNGWKQLGLRHKFEIAFLFLIIYAWLITRLDVRFGLWLTRENITPSGLALLVAHVFILSYMMAGPLIILYLFPRQKTIKPFLTQPLDHNQTLGLCAYFYGKYQIIPVLLFVPVIFALALNQAFAALLSMLIFGIWSVIIFHLHFRLYFRTANPRLYLLIQTAALILFHVLFAICYWLLAAPLWFEGVLIPAAIVGLVYLIKFNEPVDLVRMVPTQDRQYRPGPAGRISFASIPRFLPATAQACFNKELLGLWRNRAYRRLKIYTFTGYVLLLTALQVAAVPDFVQWATLLSAVLIWLHYSSHFSEKFVQPEPQWYYQTLPIRFSLVMLAKFLVEILFILILLSNYALFMYFTETGGEIVQLLAALLIFSVIVLGLMLNMQIMFYDDPRLAGYAYHFMVLFLTIMSVNYHLVGPLVSLFLIAFYFYKNYKYVNS